MDETLKLIPNLDHYVEDAVTSMPHLSEAVSPIADILRATSLPSPPLQPPVSNLINALMNLKLESTEPGSPQYDSLFPKSDPSSLISALTKILDISVSGYPERELDKIASPLVTLLRLLATICPKSTTTFLQSQLLPSKESRAEPIGTDSTLPSKLLKLSINPLLPMLGPSISALLFTLSNNDAQEYIQNIGYGYAAGFLNSHSIAVPESALDGTGTTAAQDSQIYPGVSGTQINPITGQILDTGPVDTGPEMTDEEKEQEAERLFVLFERLRATGVVDVENPVRRAVEEGRFEEIE